MTTFILYEFFSLLFVCVYMVCACVTVVLGCAQCMGRWDVKEEHTGVDSFLPLWDMSIELVSSGLQCKCY